MESRGQEKDLGLPYSMANYNPPPFNCESSAKLTSEAGRGSTIPIQTLDQQQQNPSPQQQQYIHRDSTPDPDPVQVQVAGASNSKAPPPQPPPLSSGANNASSSSVRYRECLKNHAASMGGHVTDGCGEFMPCGEEGTPEALRCAACECHRNFHRKEGDGEAQAAAATTSHHYIHNHRHNNNTNPYQTSVFRTLPQSASLITMPSHHHHQQQQHHQHHHQIFSHTYSHGLTTSPTGPMVPMMMAFGGNSGGAAESSSEDLNMFQYDAGGQAVHQSKKRFRTKFTQQQKDRMHEFAEQLGWKIQKQDEQQVQQFCNEVGVKRQVFKVWMHNNKQAMKKKQM